MIATLDGFNFDMRTIGITLAFVTAFFVHIAAQAQGLDGEALYRANCEHCHESSTGRAPPRLILRQQTPENIIESLTAGSMQFEASGLSAAERTAIATYVSSRRLGESPLVQLQPNLCKHPPRRLDLSAPQWNGWGNRPENWRYQPKPGLTAANVRRLKVKWVFRYPQQGTANGQPTVIGDRVFITSEARKVYALDVGTGCTYWTFDADAGVRTAVSVGPPPAGSQAAAAVYFGDTRANVYAIDADTGAWLWQEKIDSHGSARITGAPILFERRLYVPVSSLEEVSALSERYDCCTFRGNLVALDIDGGYVKWRAYTNETSRWPYQYGKTSAGARRYGPAGGAIWSSPTLDPKRRAIYVATGNSYTDIEHEGSDAVIAFDLDTGKPRWRRQVTPNDSFLVGCNKSAPNCPTTLGPDFDFGASPILHSLSDGADILIAAQKSGVVYGIDPDNGEIVWQTRIGQGSELGGIEFGHATDERHVYAAVADHLRKNGTPNLSALDIATGKVMWTTPTPDVNCKSSGPIGCRGQSAAVTVIPGIVFSGALDGHLRAYNTTTGRIVWDFDTGIDFKPVNAETARGGAIDSGGPTIANGTMFVNSGYGKTPDSGNVLLVFTKDGK